MKNFIDFVSEASANQTLSEELAGIVEKGNHETVSRWFSQKGYAVSSEECKKLTAKDNLVNRNIGLWPY